MMYTNSNCPELFDVYQYHCERSAIQGYQKSFQPKKRPPLDALTSDFYIGVHKLKITYFLLSHMSYNQLIRVPWTKIIKRRLCGLQRH